MISNFNQNVRSNANSRRAMFEDFHNFFKDSGILKEHMCENDNVRYVIERLYDFHKKQVQKYLQKGYNTKQFSLQNNSYDLSMNWWLDGVKKTNWTISDAILQVDRMLDYLIKYDDMDSISEIFHECRNEFNSIKENFRQQQLNHSDSSEIYISDRPSQHSSSINQGNNRSIGTRNMKNKCSNKLPGKNTYTKDDM